MFSVNDQRQRLDKLDSANCLPLILVKVFSPAVRNPLDSTYYKIAANFFASVFNYDIVSRHLADFGDAIEFTQYMCLLLLFIRILAALMAKMLDGPQ